MMKTITSNKKTTFAVLGVILAVAVLVSSAALSVGNEASAEVTPFPSREKVISVTGVATASVEPDLLVVRFGVETQQKTAADALDANSELMNKVVDAIKKVGITEKEISTSRFNIQPVYEGFEDRDTKRWKQELVGYRVANTVSVETSKLDSAPGIIDGAVSAGANKVDSVQFTLSPEKEMQIKDELIEKAVQNAKKKAENALGPLDHQIIGVKMVSLSEFGIPPPIPVFESFDSAVAEKSVRSTPVFSSEQDVRTTANVVFLIGSS